MRVPREPAEAPEPIGPPPNEDETYELNLDKAPAEIAGEEGGAGAADAPGSAAAANGKCPSCNQKLKPGAVICVQCGFSLEQGRKLRTRVAEPTAAAVEPEGDDAEEAGGASSKVSAAVQAVAGTVSPVARALESREDEVQPSRVTDVYAPVVLIVIGLASRVLMYWRSGLDWSDYLETMTLDVFFSYPLMVCAVWLVTKIFGTSLGHPGWALLKLAGILIGVDLIDTLITAWLGSFAWSFPGIILTVSLYIGLYLALFMWLLEFDADEAMGAIAATLIVHVVLRGGLVVFVLPEIYALLP